MNLQFHVHFLCHCKAFLHLCFACLPFFLFSLPELEQKYTQSLTLHTHPRTENVVFSGLQKCKSELCSRMYLFKLVSLSLQTRCFLNQLQNVNFSVLMLGLQVRIFVLKKKNVKIVCCLRVRLSITGAEAPGVLTRALFRIVFFFFLFFLQVLVFPLCNFILSMCHKKKPCWFS